MADINELIRKKLEELPQNVAELATEAIKLSEKGLSEVSIAEQLSNVVRRIARAKGEVE